MGSGNSKPSSSNPQSSGISATLSSVFNSVPYTVNSTTYKRYALFIGCNYIGTNFQLNGCINDVLNVKKLTDTWGFDATLMTDNALRPTKSNIISQLTAHINRLVSGDVLLIYYSGHGATVTDTNGDELSGKDSVIVPLDVQSQGYIIDDTIRSILIQAVTGAKVFAVFDSCNSGSVCDLKYNYFDTSYKLNPADKSTNDLVSRTNTSVNNNYTDTNASIVTISGCKDDQLSYETVNSNGQYGGALTYCLLKYIYEQTPDISFGQLLQSVRSMLTSNGFNQRPSLMSGTQFDTDTKLSIFLNI